MRLPGGLPLLLGFLLLSNRRSPLVATFFTTEEINPFSAIYNFKKVVDRKWFFALHTRKSHRRKLLIAEMSKATEKLMKFKKAEADLPASIQPSIRFTPKKYLSDYRSAKRLRMRTRTRVTISETKAKELDIVLRNFLNNMMLPYREKHWSKDDIRPPVIFLHVEIAKKAFSVEVGETDGKGAILGQRTSPKNRKPEQCSIWNLP